MKGEPVQEIWAGVDEKCWLIWVMTDIHARIKEMHLYKALKHLAESVTKFAPGEVFAPRSTLAVHAFAIRKPEHAIDYNQGEVSTNSRRDIGSDLDLIDAIASGLFHVGFRRLNQTPKAHCSVVGILGDTEHLDDCWLRRSASELSSYLATTE